MSMTLEAALAWVKSHEATSMEETAQALLALVNGTGPTPDQPHRPAHVDVTEDEATGDILDTPGWELDLAALTQTSHEIAKSKGWWDKDRSFAALTLLMQSEISEALEDYRAGKKLDETWYEHKLPNNPAEPGASALFRALDIPDPRAFIDASPVGPDGTLGKFCGIPSEIADVVIRICDFAGRYDIPLKNLTPLQPSEDFEVALAKATFEISKAFDILHTLTTSKSLVAISLSLAIAHLVHMCKAQGIDLAKAIEIKTAFNRTRPIRHGGKAL